MKKLLTLFAACIFGAVMVYADVLKLQATSLAFKSQNDYGYWSDWSDWESTNILVVVNTDIDRVNIYSSSPQEYDIYDYDAEEKDGEGGTISTCHCIDQNGTRCDMRIRFQANGQVQLYVDYADFMFVYNVQRK